jgi:hypothetical protein
MTIPRKQTRSGTRGLWIVDAIAQADAADVATLAATDDLDQALTATDAATITAALLQRRAAILTDAASQVHGRMTAAALTDPTFLRWRAECQTILDEWLAAQRFDAPPDEREGERVRRLQMFAHHHGG